MFPQPENRYLSTGGIEENENDKRRREKNGKLSALIRNGFVGRLMNLQYPNRLRRRRKCGDLVPGAMRVKACAYDKKRHPRAGWDRGIRADRTRARSVW